MYVYMCECIPRYPVRVILVKRMIFGSGAGGWRGEQRIRQVAISRGVFLTSLLPEYKAAQKRASESLQDVAKKICIFEREGERESKMLDVFLSSFFFLIRVDACGCRFVYFSVRFSVWLITDKHTHTYVYKYIYTHTHKYISYQVSLPMFTYLHRHKPFSFSNPSEKP